MAENVIDALCKALSAKSMMAHLEEFSKRVKLSGTKEELESFNYIKGKLDKYGLNTSLILHDAYISLPLSASLSIDETSIRCITHSFSASSPPMGARAQVVYAGAGSAQDFSTIDARGKIVLLDFIANEGATFRATKAGAVGQIHISPHEHLHEKSLSPVWGSPSDKTLHLLPTTIVVSIDKANGEAIKRRVLAGELFEVTLHAAVDTGWRKTPLLTADLMSDMAGSDQPFVMFSGHHDTWHLGVMDNGTANATMLEVARLFAQQRAHLRRGLRLCFWSGHSHGQYAGSTWYADNHWKELDTRCVAHVNIDSVGGMGATVLADVLSSSELGALASEAVARQGNQERVGRRMSRAGDQSFWGIGVPSMYMGMGEQPPGSINPIGAVLGGADRRSAGFGWWWHTPEDTLDKIDPELLVRDARIYVHTLYRLLTDAVLPIDYEAHAETLRSEVAAIEARIGSNFDLDPLIEAVQRTAQSAALLKRSVEAALPEEMIDRINNSIMAASRAMVPMDYTNGDRFDWDPGLGASPYPVLDPLRRLATIDAASDEWKFVVISAQRSVNRLIHALDKASKALTTGGGRC